MTFITENIGFLLRVAGIFIACSAALVAIYWIATDDEPEPTAGMGDKPAWLRNGEEEREPHGSKEMRGLDSTKGD